MKSFKFSIFIAAILIWIFLIYYVITSEYALVTNPKGIIARNQLHLMQTNASLMLIVVIPTFILLFVTVYLFRSSRKAKYDPDHSHGAWGEIIKWIIPAIIIAPMIAITWEKTHQLDPYQPIQSDKKPLVIQVVAMNWKWLFIYPEQGIATLNHVQFPAGTPIHFNLTADHSPMNSFWIPQLSGQIYSMTGMQTQIHMMADAPGEYRGRAAEINGEGYPDMTFSVKSTSQDDFDSWVSHVQLSPLQLTDEAYSELSKHEINSSVLFYSLVNKNLFDNIVMKYM